MRFVRLEDVCDIIIGRTPARKESKYWNQGSIPWVSIADMNNQPILIKTKEGITETAIKDLKLRPAREGTVLFSFKLTIGKISIAGRDLFTNEAIASLPIKDSNKLDNRFLARILEAIDFKGLGNRAAMGRTLNKKSLAEIVIPLPRLEEQKRIAAILDQADVLRRLRRQAIDRLSILSQAFFHEMFGLARSPAINVRSSLPDLPSGWSWEKLTSVARMATGHTPDRKMREYWDGDVSWISLREIREFDGREVEETEIKITELGLKNSSAVLLPVNTVCLSRTASLGFVALTTKEMATSQDFVNWSCGPRLNPRYLIQAMISARSEIRSLATGSTHRTIYFPTAKQFNVLVPPRKLQDKFVERISSIASQIAILERSSNRLNVLFASLQYRAFHGEL